MHRCHAQSVPKDGGRGVLRSLLRKVFVDAGPNHLSAPSLGQPLLQYCTLQPVACLRQGLITPHCPFLLYPRSPQDEITLDQRRTISHSHFSLRQRVSLVQIAKLTIDPLHSSLLPIMDPLERTASPYVDPSVQGPRAQLLTTGIQSTYRKSRLTQPPRFLTFGHHMLTRRSQCFPTASTRPVCTLEVSSKLAARWSS